MNKVLFLDVDGVLNGGSTTTKAPNGFTGVDDDKCERLNRIIAETGCEVVLSSTWRKFPVMLPYLWARVRLGEQRHVSFTPDFPGQPRGAEILAWMGKRGVPKSFVILDDQADMAELLPHLVQTDYFVGLTDEIASEVIRRLNA